MQAPTPITVQTRVPLALLLVCALLSSCFSENAGAKGPQAPTLGSLQVTGEAYVNGMRAVAEQTIFVGDTVRTGADGRGAVMMPVGALTLGPGTEVAFGSASLLGTVRMGTVEVRTLQAGQSLEIQFGNQVTYLPYFEGQSAGIVTVGADRSARIECRVGSVSLTANQGSGVVSLGPGQFVTIAPDGKLGSIGPGTPAAAAPAG
jgi:hypothetical protein